MALHIEVDAREGQKAASGLARLYGSSSTKFPLGIQMQLVSEYREVKGNPTMTGKHMRLRMRQASFSSLITGHPNDDIMILDYDMNGITLRNLIMKIQSANPATPRNICHTVRQD